MVGLFKVAGKANMTDFKRMRLHAERVCDTVETKDKDYGSSWRRRGGPGAFMVMARKWDRIENLVKQDGWDIFKSIEHNLGGIEDDIDDLIGYLLLIREHCLPKPATLVQMPPLDYKIYESQQAIFLSDQTFLCEGGYGNGLNLYTHRETKEKVQAPGLKEAHEVWGRFNPASHDADLSAPLETGDVT